MSVIRVDHVRLLDISQTLAAELRRPRDFVDELESWAQDIEANEALKTLDELDYGSRIREVRARFTENLDELDKLVTAMGAVAKAYAKNDEWASRLLSDSDEKIMALLDPSHGEKVVFGGSGHMRDEYTVIDTEHFRFKIHGYNYKVEGNLGAGTDGYNLKSDTHVVVAGPAAGGVLEFGSKDNNLRITYGASAPSVEGHVDVHVGDKGGGGTTGGQVQLGNVSLGVGLTVDGQGYDLTASKGKSMGSVVTEDVNFDEGTASFGGELGKGSPIGLQFTTGPRRP